MGLKVSNQTKLKNQRCFLDNGNSATKLLKKMATYEGVLAIRHVFCLVDIITNTKFSDCPNVLKIGADQQKKI